MLLIFSNDKIDNSNNFEGVIKNYNQFLLYVV